MSISLPEPSYVDEPREAKEYAELVTRVSTEHRAVVVRRNGEDVAAIVPLDCLESLREEAIMAELQLRLRKMDLARMAKDNPPPQEWFDRDEPKPF